MINPHCHVTLADLKLPIPRWLSSYVVQVGQWLRSNFIWSHDCHVTSSHPQSRGTWRRRPCWCSQHCVWCTRGMPCLKGECCLDNCHFCSCRATFNPLLSCDQKTIPSLLFFTPLSPLLTSLPPSLRQRLPHTKCCIRRDWHHKESRRHWKIQDRAGRVFLVNNRRKTMYFLNKCVPFISDVQ